MVAAADQRFLFLHTGARKYHPGENYMVTILLATYNGEKYLGELIDSLLCQTYKDIRIAIRDDCSKDKTRGIILDYQQKFADTIRFMDSNEPSGSAMNNFFSLLAAVDLEGEYFMFCDQDDYWRPDKVKQTLLLMEETQAGDRSIPVLVHTDLVVADASLSEIAPSFIRYQGLHPSRCGLNYLLVQNNITGCTMMFNRRLLELTAGIKGTDNIMMHDWWMGLIASAFGKVAFLDSPTILYRQHGSNEVGAINIHSLAYIIRTIKKARDPGRGSALSAIQAEKFEYCFGDMLTPRQREMVHTFAHLLESSRPQRLRSRLKYRFFMQRPIMTFLQITHNILFLWKK